MIVLFVVALFGWFAGMVVWMLEDLDELRAETDEFEEVGVDRSASLPPPGGLTAGTVDVDGPQSVDSVARTSGGSSPGGSNLPPDEMAAAPRVCADCGHLEAQHFGFGWAGHTGCAATIDPRTPGAGGENVTPCKCQGFRV